MGLSEAVLRDYSTKMGEYVTVKNLQRGQLGGSLEPMMTSLRDKDTKMREFRLLAKEIYNIYIIPEFLQTLTMQEVTITTGNNCKYVGRVFIPQEIVVIDIPTAGTAPAELMIDQLNYIIGDHGFDIHKGVIDITRIEGAGGALRHDMQRVKMRSIGPNTYAVFPDIMLASAGTYETAVNEVLNPERHFDKGGSISKIFLAPLISSAEGICNVSLMLENLKTPSQIVSASIDPELDVRKYIRPGLGDAGDRMNNR